MPRQPETPNQDKGDTEHNASPDHDFIKYFKDIRSIEDVSYPDLEDAGAFIRVAEDVDAVNFIKRGKFRDDKASIDSHFIVDAFWRLTICVSRW